MNFESFLMLVLVTHAETRVKLQLLSFLTSGFTQLLPASYNRWLCTCEI